MIQITIPQGHNPQATIDFRPATDRNTPQGEIALEILETLNERLKLVKTKNDVVTEEPAEKEDNQEQDLGKENDPAPPPPPAPLGQGGLGNPTPVVPPSPAQPPVAPEPPADPETETQP